VVCGTYGGITESYRPRSLVEPGRPPTMRDLGKGSSGVASGAEYGTWRPGVRRVIDMANEG
jgi:hypothetical protein